MRPPLALGAGVPQEADVPEHHLVDELGAVTGYSLTIASACGDRFAGDGQSWGTARAAALEAFYAHLDEVKHR